VIAGPEEAKNPAGEVPPPSDLVATCTFYTGTVRPCLSGTT